MFWVAPEDE
jgi:hypothetical protein